MPNVARFFTVAAVCLSTGTFLPAQPATGATTTLLGFQAAVPAGWSARTPSSTMRLAEYATRNATGGAGADVVVYFFGPGQGGGPTANLERWKSQFSNPGGGDVYEKVSVDSTATAKLTIAEYRGTYARGIGAGSSAEQAKPGQTLLAVVAETARGTLFFQCFGDTADVESQRAAYLRFVKSLK